MSIKFWIQTLLTSTISLPCLLMFLFIEKRRPKYYGWLFWGILFVAYGAAVFSNLSEIIIKITERFSKFSNPTPEDKKIMTDIKCNLEAWLYVVPAVIAAIGANLISTFLTKEKNIG